ncbi:disulfide bond formation protein B [Hirschia litorea]|uniref:Disulfide bond formation protein B n=1 Tax=Hirschia litorea TaxID=1199156 RepID=A0ABW2ILJ3_9PROT
MISKLLSHRTWPFVAILVSIFMLASAHAFEIFGKMYPCDLCLKQREPYWAAIAISIAGLILARNKPHWPVLKIVSAILGVVFLYGAGYGLYHSAVEMGLISTGCSSAGFDPTHFQSLDQPMVVGKCDEPPLVIFGVTMANMNAFASLCFMVCSFITATKSTKSTA